ncbi:MAG: RraA family protein [Rhizobiaceae bacterium]|nr:RraA family protein [Rhizobiaceae bacterium]
MADDQVYESWRNIPPAIAVDMDWSSCQIDPDVRPLNPAGQQPKLFGTAVTAKCSPPDFGSVLKAADLIKPGDVLVISADGHRDTAMIGEIICGVVKRNGGVGVICDGAIRDVGELAKMTNFSVFTRHITPRGPAFAETIEINGPVMFGGQEINPGDLIIGDDDGLARLTPELAKKLLPQAQEKLQSEDKWMSQFDAGETVTSVFDLP